MLYRKSNVNTVVANKNWPLQDDLIGFDEFRVIEGACFMSLSAFTGMRISESEASFGPSCDK
ncbi:MAG: hypothetical protein ACJASB_001917 [Shewanella psychromarinicola]|jgi:hypothetical protein